MKTWSSKRSVFVAFQPHSLWQRGFGQGLADFVSGRVRQATQAFEQAQGVQYGGVDAHADRRIARFYPQPLVSRRRHPSRQKPPPAMRREGACREMRFFPGGSFQGASSRRKKRLGWVPGVTLTVITWLPAVAVKGWAGVTPLLTMLKPLRLVEPVS